MKNFAVAAVLAAAVSTTCLAGFNAVLHDGDVKVSARSEADAVRLESDFDLTLDVEYPSDVKVEVPQVTALRARFRGFSLAEGFARDPVAVGGGRMSMSFRWRLVPQPGEECKLAPFAVYVVKNGERSSFATSAIAFPISSLPSATGEIDVSLRPYRIAPSVRSVLSTALWTLLGLFAAAVVAFLARKIRRSIKLRAMTPGERALAELEDLLRKRYPSKGLFKDFFIGLTHVVRRYIERTYGIRAPEQTTEEFLAAARESGKFPPESIAGLSEFLNSADMVKFAGRDSDETVADGAVETARRFIKSDSEMHVRDPQANGGKGGAK